MTPYLDAWRERRLPLAPWRLLRLVAPRRLLLVRVPRRGTGVGSTRTAPGAAAPFPGRTAAPVHRLPLVVPQPLVAVPGRAVRGGLVGVKGGLEVGVEAIVVNVQFKMKQHKKNVTVTAFLHWLSLSGCCLWAFTTSTTLPKGYYFSTSFVERPSKG